MSPRQRRGLLVTLLGVVAAVVAFVAVANYTAQIAQQVGPRTAVYVVARDIPAFSPIVESDLRKDEVPRKYLSAATVTSPDELEGMVSATDLTMGALLQVSSLITVPAATPEERVISLEVDIEASVAGSVGPDDRVDVVAATKGAGTRRSVVRTVVSGVRTLRVEPISSPGSTGIGVGSAPVEADEEAQPQGTSTYVVTLAVTPRQSEQVILADTIADSVRLALIPPTTLSALEASALTSAAEEAGR